MKRLWLRLIAVVPVLLISGWVWPQSVEAVTRNIVFPVIGSSSYSNDYNAPRANGPHHAIDIIASKRQKIVVARGGTVVYVAYPEPSWGYMVSIRDDSGYRYNYLHINNDTPGKL